MTAKITGKNAVITWTSTAGTVTLNTDYRSVTQSPGVNLADCTAGADPYKKYIATIKDATIEYAGLLGTGGSATLAALEPGISGTLIVQPEGTASGAPSRKSSSPMRSFAGTWRHTNGGSIGGCPRRPRRSGVSYKSGCPVS